MSRPGPDEEARLARRWPWLLPLAAGIFLGAALLEMLPEGLARAGAPAGLWAGAGLAVFLGVRVGLDLAGRRGIAWVATLGIWFHSFLEGAIAASSYGVNLLVGLLVSLGLILHLIPEVAAVIALLTAVGLSLRQALWRNLLTWAMIGLGFVVVALLLPGLPPSTLGSALAFAGGGFLALAYFSWQERQWGLAGSVVAVLLGVLIVGLLRLVT